MGPAKWTGGRAELMLTSFPRPAPPLPFGPRGRPWTAFGATHVTCPQCSLPDVQQRVVIRTAFWAGDRGRARTCTRQLRRLVLYPVELRGRHCAQDHAGRSVWPELNPGLFKSVPDHPHVGDCNWRLTIHALGPHKRLRAKLARASEKPSVPSQQAPSCSNLRTGDHVRLLALVGPTIALGGCDFLSNQACHVCSNEAGRGRHAKHPPSRRHQRYQREGEHGRHVPRRQPVPSRPRMNRRLVPAR
jgi:hypothetical protein